MGNLEKWVKNRVSDKPYFEGLEIRFEYGSDINSNFTLLKIGQKGWLQNRSVYIALLYAYCLFCMDSIYISIIYNMIFHLHVIAKSMWTPLLTIEFRHFRMNLGLPECLLPTTKFSGEEIVAGVFYLGFVPSIYFQWKCYSIQRHFR